jgi:hypothetical protein
VVDYSEIRLSQVGYSGSGFVVCDDYQKIARLHITRGCEPLSGLNLNVQRGWVRFRKLRLRGERLIAYMARSNGNGESDSHTSGQENSCPYRSSDCHADVSPSGCHRQKACHKIGAHF